MLEDQPLDLSVRVGDYAEFSREENDQDQEQDQDRKEPIDDYGNAAAALRLRGCFVAASSTEYSQEREDRTCSEDSDDSCSDNNQKDGTTRSRSRPPGTKPYKKNLMRRYRESRSVFSYLPFICIRAFSAAIVETISVFYRVHGATLFFTARYLIASSLPFPINPLIDYLTNLESSTR